MAEARTAILARLRAAGPAPEFPVADDAILARRAWPPAERLARLHKGMEAVKTEFVEATEADWPSKVREIAAMEGLRNLLYGPGTTDGRRLAALWDLPACELVAYDQQVEACKDRLFHEIDAGFTSTVAGIADTGGLLLEPGPAEPRLLSLVPPVHLALLRATTVEDSFWSAQRRLGWNQKMPPNALLISGPSKTADIEQTLAYGVHGPKRLIVVLVQDLA